MVCTQLAAAAVAAEAQQSPAAQDWQSEVQRSLAAQEYQISEQPAADCAPEAYSEDLIQQAPNRAHNLRTCFTGEGVHVVPRTGSDRWRWGMALEAYGGEDELRAVTPTEPLASGNRVEYARGPVTEWYVNDPRGLEQGFTLSQPLTDSATTVLRIGILGDLMPQAAGEAVAFQSSGGVRVLEYGRLEARDAAGRELPAAMHLAGRAIEIRVATAGAAYPVTVDPLAINPTWSIEGNAIDRFLGYSVATAGDVNADGYSDFIVGTPFFDGGDTDEGVAYVFLGSATGPAVQPHRTYEGNAFGASLGYSVATAGDVNGDGYSDVILGVPFDGNGHALVFHGSATGLGTTAAWDRTITGSGTFASFGQAVAPAGDVNGDGYSDVIVGAPGHEVGGLLSDFNEGHAFVYLGGSAGLATTPVWSAEANQTGAELGNAVATAGDVNGDGYSDVIVGAWRYDINTNDNRGRIFLYHGAASGVLMAGGATSPTVGSTDYGVSVSTAGDFDGDGYSDVVVGAPLTDALGLTDSGVVYFYRGGPGGVATASPLASNDSTNLARMGSAVASAGDINGDGYGDVVVGAPEATVSGVSFAGRAAVYYGNSDFDTTLGEYVIDVNQSAPTVNANFGSAVATAGDVNGDGFADLLVGVKDYAFGQSNEGRAHLYYGGPSPPGQASGWSISNGSAGHGFTVAGAGDVNGDGYADVIFGMPFYDNGTGDEGWASIHLGSAEGLVPTSPPVWSVFSTVPQAQFGTSVAAAGDVNGDGFGDVIVSAPKAGNGEAAEGLAYVYHGGPGGPSTTPARTLEANVASARFGSSAATAGDVNGDGYSDVVVGAPFYNNGEIEEGAAFVYLGSPSGVLAVAHWNNESNMPESNLGWSVATAGDVNGDGYSDVIVGWPFYSNGQSSEGTALVYHGGPSGLSVTPAWTAEPDHVAANFGYSVATAGDVNGDGFADVVVGAPGGYSVGSIGGAALVYLGDTGGLASGWSAYLNEALAGDRLGFSVATAGDVNGDGFADVIVGSPTRHGGLVGPEAGAAYVYAGSPSGTRENPYWSRPGVLQNSWSGYSVASAGDVNGDGFDDLLVGGVPYYASLLQGGRADLYYSNGPANPLSTYVVNRGGVALNAIQRPTTVLAPLAPLGGTGALVDGVSLQANGRTPFGRSDVSLDWELQPAGSPFFREDATVVEPGWADSGLAGTSVSAEPAGLLIGQAYRWRLRIRYRPSTTPFQPHGPWLTSAVNTLQGLDFRTEVDTDADAIIDRFDNCKLAANFVQRDSDADCFGNQCDADLNNSGGLVNFGDLAQFRAMFGTVAPLADFNGSDGIVNFQDLAIFRALFGRPAGPSGLLPLSTTPQPGLCGP